MFFLWRVSLQCGHPAVVGKNLLVKQVKQPLVTIVMKSLEKSSPGPAVQLYVLAWAK